ncbi:GmrSD restriction endonuclease domain-containing protein [Streptomyces sp. Je 1-369]|uniref:GmrSD restriction endonuclease domain-containing protein n=1 Tax=Streptomyces sp. Je 1-369 TaxID=2966192 RepID=UPI00228626C4|nr:DUF262 domain-containing protein [Streptomyces sp. Je 1-369]WAL95709.1 DUF262 domain-containing protein [Streptomyces sp. Je 1-369]
MAVERTNRDVQTLIAQISAGEIMLPEIQRGYVWKATQIAKLVESLYRGYPAGSLLLWKTDEPPETRAAAIGSSQPIPSVMPLYLLDGQQRLTSLYRVLTDHADAQIVFNIETEAFQNQSAATRRNKKWVRVYDVVRPDADTFALYSELQSADLTISDAKIRQRLKALERITERDFHMEVLHEFEYEEVTQIFVRVNSGGRALKTTDLAMATLSARSPGFLRQLEEESAHWAELGYRAIDVNFLIKAITLSLSISGKRTSSVSRLTTASRESVAEAWERVRRGLERVVSLLKDRLLVPTTALIPSISALHPLIVFLGREPVVARIAPEMEDGLLYWFMAATARNRYGGATDSSLTRDVKALDTEDPVRSLLANVGIDGSGLVVTARDLVGRNQSSPYFLFCYLAAAHADAHDWWDGGPISATAEGSDKPEYSNIHPAQTLRSHQNKYSAADINELANIVFVSEGTAKNIIGRRSPAAYIQQVAASDLTAHAIPTEPRVLEASGYSQFLAARRMLLAGRITGLLNQFRPAFLSGETHEQPHPEVQRSLTLVAYTAGHGTNLVAQAILNKRSWTGKINVAELEAALDTAASGIDSDVTIAGESSPLQTDEDGVTLPIGPFRVRGTINQWRASLKAVFEDVRPSASDQEVQESQWSGDLDELLLTDIGRHSA